MTLQTIDNLFTTLVQPLGAGNTQGQQIGQRILYTDIARYTSMAIPTEELQEKEITINVSELVGTLGGVTAVLGGLWMWVSISNDGINYTALGGQTTPSGLFVQPFPPTFVTPLNPVILVPTANAVGPSIRDNKHLRTIAWSIHSRYARLELQQPIAGSITGSIGAQPLMWIVSAQFGGRA